MKTIGQDFFKIIFIFFVKSNHSSPKGSVRSKNKLPPLLEDTEIEVILSRADQLVSWVNDIKEYALQQAISGKEWTGFKLVEGRSNRHLRQKGKIAELALGYGGSVGALKAMGAMEMGLSEDELPLLVDAWRQANPKIVEFWWAVDRAIMEAVKHKHTTSLYGLTFSCRSGMLFITLPLCLSPHRVYLLPICRRHRYEYRCRQTLQPLCWTCH